MAREGEGANAPQQESPQYDLLSDLFNRLANANISIGQVQMAMQIASAKAVEELREVQANAELQQDYLLERLKQCQDAAAAVSSPSETLELGDPRIQPPELGRGNAVEGWNDVDYSPEEDCDA